MRKAALLLTLLTLLGCDDSGDVGGREAENGKNDDVKTDDGEAGSTGSKLSDKDLTKKVADKLVTCGLFEASEQSEGEVQDDYDRCATRCVLAADCDELRKARCDPFAEQTGDIVACLTKCELSPKDGYVCKDGAKIAHVLVCDGVPQCVGKEDEAKCPSLCKDGSAPNERVFECDGTKDCKDGSDEVDCPICTE